MRREKINALSAILLTVILTATSLQAEPENHPPVYPIPQEAEYGNDFFGLNEQTVVLLPEHPDLRDSFLAHLLIAELAEQYDLSLGTETAAGLEGKTNYILLGAVSNPLVREYAEKHNIPASAVNPGHEGYFLHVGSKGAAVLGSDAEGAFYGLQSLRQLINNNEAEAIRHATIRDWPHMPFRGIHMYIPGPENIPFFKRFVRDFMAYYKYNKIILEVNAVMRFDRHPELNAGWLELRKDNRYTRRRKAEGIKGDPNQDSVHDNAGDGKVLDKEQVADLVDYARKFHIEVIPEIPSLAHSYYLLTRHRELAEIEEAEWPDAYCPLEPGSYELYFDVLDEYIEVIRPEVISIGHDEWRMPFNICEKCRGKEYSELFIGDVLKIHDYLGAKGIRTAMWGDHFVEDHAGKGLQTRRVESTGWEYQKPGALTPEQVMEHIPKDILILNWSWGLRGRTDEQNLKNATNFADWGFEQVLGNFNLYDEYFEHRSRIKGMLGAEVSPWRTNNEELMSTRMNRMLGGANHLWSTHHTGREVYSRIAQHHMPQIRVYLKGEKPPSMDGNPMKTLDISQALNTSPGDHPRDIDLGLLKQGNVTSGRVSFKLVNPSEVPGGHCANVVQNAGSSGSGATRSDIMPVGLDASSLVFLHSCAHPSEVHDLLGWYRVVYEDGFEELVPIIYGVNIMEWHRWGADPRTGEPDPRLKELPPTGAARFAKVCYEADAVNCSGTPDKEMTFWAYEWRNPRFGIKIKEVRLEGSKFRSESYKHSFARDGEPIPDNAIALAAISCVTKRDPASSAAKAAFVNK
jgi:hypothetical protein